MAGAPAVELLAEELAKLSAESSEVGAFADFLLDPPQLLFVGNPLLIRHEEGARDFLVLDDLPRGVERRG